MLIKATQNKSFFFFIQLRGFQVSKAPQMAPEVKNPPANAGDLRDGVSIPGLGRSRGEGHGKIFQCSWLENPMDKGAGQATVHRVAKSWTRLKWLSMHTCRYTRKSCFLLHIYRPAPYSSALLAFSHPCHFPEHFSGVHVPLELMLPDCTQSNTDWNSTIISPNLDAVLYEILELYWLLW